MTSNQIKDLRLAFMVLNGWSIRDDFKYGLMIFPSGFNEGKCGWYGYDDVLETHHFKSLFPSDVPDQADYMLNAVLSSFCQLPND